MHPQPGRAPIASSARQGYSPESMRGRFRPRCAPPVRAGAVALSTGQSASYHRSRGTTVRAQSSSGIQSWSPVAALRSGSLGWQCRIVNSTFHGTRSPPQSTAVPTAPLAEPGRVVPDQRLRHDAQPGADRPNDPKADPVSAATGSSLRQPSRIPGDHLQRQRRPSLSEPQPHLRRREPQVTG